MCTHVSQSDIFVVKYTGRGLVVKRPGVLSKVQLLNLVLGVGVFSLLPNTGVKIPKSGKRGRDGMLSKRIRKGKGT